MNRSALLLAVALVVAPLGQAVAQVRLPSQPPIKQLNGPRSATDTQPIPVAYRPPPGMCRVWLDGVPPAQQPAPTDCATAVRNRPGNGKVIFGDDYVEKRGKDKDKKPTAELPAGVPGAPSPEMYAMANGAMAGRAMAQPASPRVHGPNAGDALDLEVQGVVVSEDFMQPPARRQTTTATRPRAAPRDTLDDDDYDAPPQDPRSLSAQRAARRQARVDSIRAADQRRRDDWSARRYGIARPDPAGRTPSARQNGRAYTPGDQRDGPAVRGRDAQGSNAQGRDPRDPRDPRNDPQYNDPNYDARYGYGAYGGAYGRAYPPPARANGICLDRDGDGWCDDARTNGGYCRDLDGDGRCDDYPGLASAPYSSSMPPMRAALDVQQGFGSEAALRWLGTAEVTVRTTDLKRTGAPYRAMWLDANTGRLLQVWTDTDGDGIANRIEIYRNGRIAKTIGR